MRRKGRSSEWDPALTDGGLLKAMFCLEEKEHQTFAYLYLTSICKHWQQIWSKQTSGELCDLNDTLYRVFCYKTNSASLINGWGIVTAVEDLAASEWILLVRTVYVTFGLVPYSP